MHTVPRRLLHGDHHRRVLGNQDLRAGNEEAFLKKHILSKTIQTLKSNSPEILTAFGVAGVFTTSYLTGKAAYKASRIIAEDEQQGVMFENRKDRFKERVRLTWKIYIPAAGSAVLTTACIIGGSRATAKRTTAAVTAYSLTERAFTEYREKVVEEIGERKEQKIRDEIVQDHVTATPPVSREVIITSGGQVLCCELYTHRYFQSDMETLRRAQNDINMMVVNNLYVTLEEFYDLIGLPHTSVSDIVGWDSDRLMNLDITATISENGVPCLAFEYNYVKPLR